MNISILYRQAFAYRSLIKVHALIMGYSIWLLLANAYPSRIWFQVPVCFYNIPDHITIKAPETVWIQLSGKKEHLQAIDPLSLAVHINAQNFTPGPRSHTITHYDLLLPASLSIINSSPHVLSLYIT